MIEIYVDIDIFFLDFMQGTGAATAREKIKHVPWVLAAHVRPSSSGNVHIRLKMAADVCLLDALCIRAYLDDDPQRITADLRRYFHTRNEGKTGRCFDEKYYEGRLHVAGKWEPL